VQYALYDEYAFRASGISPKQIKKLTASALENQLNALLQMELDIYYAGSQKCQAVIGQLKKNFPLDRAQIKSNSPAQPATRKINRDTLFLMHSPKSVNAKILMVIEGDIDTHDDHCLAALFNAYFGTGSKSLIFKALRVDKPLAYSVGASYMPAAAAGQKGRFVAFADVKNANALECVITMREIINNMPEHRDLATQAIETTRNTISLRNAVSFRQMPALVADWRRKGFHMDPAISARKLLGQVSFGDIDTFHRKAIGGKPMYIMIVGNTNKMDIRGLEKFAELRMVDRKKLFRD
jgi:predicted Zn-dependent peptidase